MVSHMAARFLDSTAYFDHLAYTHPYLNLSIEACGLPSFLAPVATHEPLYSPLLQGAARMGAKVCPYIFKPTALFIGSPFERYMQNGLFERYYISAKNIRCATKIARAAGADLLVVPNIGATHAIVELLSHLGFKAFDSFPDNQLPLPTSYDAYIEERKTNQKNSMRRNMRRFDQSVIRLENVLPSGALGEKLYPSYRHLYDRARIKWLPHTKSYFGSLERFGRHAQFIVAFSPQKEPVGFMLYFNDGAQIQAGRMGIMPAFHQKDALYFMLYYELIRQSIKAGAKSLSLGPTTYAFKRRLGANRVATVNMVKPVSPTWRFIMHRCEPALTKALSHLKKQDFLESCY